MIVRMLVIQRNERYEGEYMPEVITMVDEVTLDENSAWWPREVARQKEIYAAESIEAWAEIDIEIPMDQVMAMLRPLREPIQASVRKVEP